MEQVDWVWVVIVFFLISITLKVDRLARQSAELKYEFEDLREKLEGAIIREELEDDIERL